MLDIEFDEVVKIMKPRQGTRRSASRVEWVEVLDSDNEPVRIECKISRRSSKQFTLQASQDSYDATLLFRVEGAADISMENLVVDEDHQVYRVLSVSIEKDRWTDDVYKRLTMKISDQGFPAPEVGP